MGAAVVVLYFLPWLDRSKVRAIPIDALGISGATEINSVRGAMGTWGPYHRLRGLSMSVLRWLRLRSRPVGLQSTASNPRAVSLLDARCAAARCRGNPRTLTLAG